MAEQTGSSRREFLTGEAALRAIESAVDAGRPNDVEPPPAALPPTYLIEVGRSAMACEFQVVLNAGEFDAGTDIALRALDLVDELENQLSVYRPHTELSYVNQHAGSEAVVVERRLFDLLSQAAELHRETHGAFDITSGPLSKVWGFYRRAGRFPDDAEIATALSHVGSQHVELDGESRSIRFRQEGLEINLNAIGKGYALDRCAEVMLAGGVANYMIHGGQSSILARGSRAGLVAPGRGWRVAVRHPLRPEKTLAEIWLRDRALGTSGSGTQFFYHQGQRYGHVLDPRTGRPAQAVLSATVLAPTAALGDALATAFFVLGLDGARDYCQRFPEISALMVVPGAKSGAVEVHPVNLPDDEWQVGADAVRPPSL